jgi:hypothetical protein
MRLIYQLRNNKTGLYYAVRGDSEAGDFFPTMQGATSSLRRKVKKGSISKDDYELVIHKLIEVNP